GARTTPAHVGRGKGVRYGGLRRGLSGHGYQPARCAEHLAPPQRHRWPHYPTRRVCDQPADARLDRNALRMAQGGCRNASGQAARPYEGRGAVSAGDGGEQPRPPAEADRRGGRVMAAPAGKVRLEVRKRACFRARDALAERLSSEKSALPTESGASPGRISTG